MKRYISLILTALVLLVPSNSYAQATISFGVPLASLSVNGSGAGTNGTAYALPGYPASVVTWTTALSATPASITILAQCSLDNTTYYTCDTSTSTAGEIRTFVTAARFLRASINAQSGVANITVTFITNAQPSVSTFTAFTSGAPLSWTSSTTDPFSSPDLNLYRRAANSLAQRNGTNPQSFCIYNTFTDASNYECLNLGVATNRFFIKQDVLGTGAQRALDMDFNTYQFMNNGSTKLTITSTGVSAAGTLFSSSPSAGVGYATGAGGAVTQITSRATGVTLNTVTGDITLVSAAGSATPNTFVVTNSSVAVIDNVVVNQKSGTDLYEIFVTNVGAGSFKITFFTTGGTTTEQPVFHFSVIKGVIS